MKTFRNCCLYISISAFFYLTSGCSNHAVPVNGPVSRSGYPAAIERAQKKKWYMVLHSGINVYSITAVQLDKAKQQATVQLDRVDSLYLTPGSQLAPSAKSRTASMHWYTSDSASYTLDEPHTIALDKVTRMERVD